MWFEVYNITTHFVFRRDILIQKKVRRKFLLPIKGKSHGMLEYNIRRKLKEK